MHVRRTALDKSMSGAVRLDLDRLKSDLRKFAEARAWEKFHSPKNLSMALAVEAGELLERFQWLTEEQSSNLGPEELRAVAEEIADVQIYLVRLADRVGVDVGKAVSRKMRSNNSRYPAKRVRGSARKYTAYRKK